MSNLITQKTEIWGGMTSIMDKAASENRSLTADESTKYGELETKFNAIVEDIKREERHNDIKKELKTPAEKRVISSGTKNLDSDEYRTAFRNFLSTGELSEVRSWNEYSSAEGGVTIPTTVYNQVQLTLAGNNVIRKIGANIISTKNPVAFPVVATSGTATWGSEAPSGSYTENDDAFGSVTVNAYKLQRVAKLSEEVLNDSAANLESTLASQVGIAFGAAEELAFISGSGVGQPLGLLRTTSVVGNNVGTATINSGSVADNMIDAYYTMPLQYRNNSYWVIGDGLAKSLRKAKTTTNEYIWQTSLVAGAPDTLIGRPVYVSSQITTSTTGKVGMLLNPTFYTIGDRTPYTTQRLNELYAAQGQIGFKFSKRVDGVLTDAKALVVLTGA